MGDATIADFLAAAVVGPDDHLVINLGERASDREAHEMLATLRAHLPKDFTDRIVLVAAEGIAVVRGGEG